MKTTAELIAFERRIADLWEAGELPDLIHLSGGEEEILLDLWNEWHKITDDDWVFSTHRNHYHALLKGISEEKLEAEIRAGRSMFIFDREKKFVTSAILAGTCCIAAGVAWQLKQEGSRARVFCFLGDGAEENGHFYEAALFVQSNNLPCKFIILDNQRQVDTDFATRRGPVSETWNPLGHFSCVERIDFTSTWPHAGSGTPKKIEFNQAVISKRLSMGVGFGVSVVTILIKHTGCIIFFPEGCGLEPVTRYIGAHTELGSSCGYQLDGKLYVIEFP